MYKKDIIEELEGFRDIVVDPDDFSIEELADKLRDYRCANCVDYESREHCGGCSKEIVIYE